MKRQLEAYLIRSNGQVSAMPTDELLVVLQQVAPGSALEGLSVPSNNADIYMFLQALKRAMHMSKILFPAMH